MTKVKDKWFDKTVQYSNSIEKMQDIFKLTRIEH